jgi:uncharacterized protein (TIGR02678 family)
VSAPVEQDVVERRQAMRALLVRPLLAAGGPDGEALALVRRHTAWLRDWLGRNTGWTLQVEPELARLRKTPADLGDATRPARDAGSDLPFSQRRYVLLCLALAALEREDRQTTLGRVADTVLAEVAGEPGFAAAGVTFELEGRDARRDLVHVVRLLLDLRVLVRVQGQEEHFVERRGDVLYDVRRPALAALLAVRRGPSTVRADASFEERLAAIVDEPRPEGEDAHHRRLRHGLTRRLLDDPVVYYDELEEDERAYLIGQRSNLLRQIHEATGLVAEVRREGIALVDPAGTLTDTRLPEEGTEGHVTLLVAEFLVDHARGTAGAGGVASPDAGVVPRAAVIAHIASKKAEHRTHWRKDALAPGAEIVLAGQALAHLEALRLVRCSESSKEGVVPLPALGRYRLLAPTSTPKPTATTTATMRDRRGAGRKPEQRGLFE